MRSWIGPFLRRTALAASIIMVLVVLFAHPWFAISRPSGGKALVAEGWMHRQGLQEAAELFQNGQYDHLYLTGTLRPFAYYLLVGDSVVVEMDAPLIGPVEIGMGGLPGTTWTLWADDTAVLNNAAPPTANVFHTTIAAPGVRRFAISVHAPTSPGTDVPAAIVARLWLNGHNAHGYLPMITIHHADGSIAPGEPTYAEQARAILLMEGVPPERMTVVPTLIVERSRTWSSARSFVQFANDKGIERFDVATLGVHARRTWTMYRKARGTRGGAGVISLHDRWCQRWTWWSNYYGWHQVLKELVAWPAPYLMDQ